jgi:hypothetical protein
MEYPFMNSNLGSDWSSPEGVVLVRSSLWMRAGFVGAGVVALAVLGAVIDDIPFVDALLVFVAGALLASYAWRRSWSLLRSIDTLSQHKAGKRPLDLTASAHKA